MYGHSGHRKLYKPTNQYYYMVAKFVYEVAEGPGDDFELARVLYTGTGRKYLHDRLRAEGCFKHSGTNDDIHLTQEPTVALGYSRQRSIFYGDSPVVLVVDVDKLSGEICYNGEYRAKALNIGSFLPYDFSIGDNGQISEQEWLGIYSMEALITKKSQEGIRHEIRKFLVAPP